MPQLLRIGPYSIYFWSNENMPLEPVHVHIAYGVPKENSTKVWITSAGGCILATNGSNIPTNVLRNIMDLISARHFEIVAKWRTFFGEVSYYC